MNEDYEIFNYPHINVPIYQEECQLNDLEKFLSGMSKCMITLEKTMKNIYIELTKRPTRFESMGQMLARHIIGDEVNKSKEERDVKTLLSNTDDATQSQLIDNIRLNLVKNVDLKVTEMNKSVINIGEVFKTLKIDI